MPAFVEVTALLPRSRRPIAVVGAANAAIPTSFARRAVFAAAFKIHLGPVAACTLAPVPFIVAPESWLISGRASEGGIVNGEVESRMPFQVHICTEV